MDERYNRADFGPMERVTRNHPCPVCGKPDWCLAAKDGSAAICQRLEDGSVKRCGDAGWLHILDDRHNGHNGHGGARRCVLTPVREQTTKPQDFSPTCAEYRLRLTDGGLKSLATDLGVSPGSLRRLGVGYDGVAFTFPMCDDSGNVIGIRRRFLNGEKASAKGGKTGLFIPTDLAGSGPLLLCEGPTDTAAALDLGFDAIGRPNCNSLVEMTVRAVRGRDEVVIIADNDQAGKAGAQRLAGALALYCQCVRVVIPPAGIKDLRQWLNAGLTTEVLRETVSLASIMRVGVAGGNKREGNQ